jgi:hypothetical protein
VARFQRARGLAADGVAWPRTRRAIARAPRADLTPAGEVDDEKSPRTTRSESSNRPADKNQDRRSSVAGRTASAASNAGRNEEAPELQWLFISGLLAFALVGVAYSLMDRLAASAKAVMPGLTTIPADDRAKWSSTAQGEAMVDDSSEPDPSRAQHAESPDPDPVPAHPARDEGDGGAGVEALGYVCVIDPGAPAEPDLREQIGAMDAHCEQRGWRLVEVARDVGLHRHGLFYALERLERSETSCLIVAELRCLSSSGAELARILTWLRDHDVRLVSIDVDLDTDAPDGRMAADALISVGEMDRGTPPGRPAVHDVPALKQHIVAMRSAGMTLQAIADRLNDEGVPTLRGGQKWRPSSVQAAAGYRRPPQPSNSGGYDRRAYRRRTEDR